MSDLEQALAALEQEGSAVRGHFDPDLAGEQWCERWLLARINRYTVEGLRKEIAPSARRPTCVSCSIGRA